MDSKKLNQTTIITRLSSPECYQLSEKRWWIKGNERDKASRIKKSSNVSQIVYNQLLKDLDLESSIYEHTLSLEQLSDCFPLSRICLDKAYNSKGLNKDEALSRLATDGRNTISPVNGQTAFRTFVKQFSNTFRLLLLAAAVICFIIFALDTTHIIELYLAITLIIVFLILCAVSYWQQGTAIKNMRGFQTIIASSCVAIRSGEKIRLSATDIVVGDIIFLSPGSRVPADLRLIHTDDLRLETSWITGEMEPLEFHGCTVGKRVSALAAQNIAFKGCLCMRGIGYGVVIRTGNETVIGRLVQMTSSQKGEPSRLDLEHRRFVYFITGLALIMGFATFLFGLVLSNFQRIVNTFVNGFLIIIIANIPQGLPITLGTALVIVARRLAKRNVFMKQLDVVETLGTATVVMCDKTGIFTINETTVTNIWYGMEYFEGDNLNVNGRYSASELEKPLSDAADNRLTALLAVMAVCNKVHVEKITSNSVHNWSKIAHNCGTLSNLTIKSLLNDKSVRKDVNESSVQRTIRAAFQHKVITGGANEVALLKCVEKYANTEEIRKNYTILYDLPFNRRRRFQMVIVREKIAPVDEDSKLYMFVKGAPEELISNCTQIATANGLEQLSQSSLGQFSEAYNKFGNEGKSCMAFAMAELKEFANLEPNIAWEHFSQHPLCFLGMVAMYDPPRQSVFKALSTMRAAGVKCFMVTGDHPSTATAVAKHFSLIAASQKPNNASPIDLDMEKSWKVPPSVIHCETLKQLSNEQWDNILVQTNVVFARATPEHKLIIVKECQKRGEIVAVTGDGILDAPALKEANVGIAMEAVGSAFAKEAADMVFTESDVKYIVEGIEEGRLLYANLKKTIAYTLAHMVPELYTVLLTFAIGFPLGLSSLQVLSIDLITEMPPSIALTYEAGEKDIMRRIPRKKTSKLVSHALLAYSYLFVGHIIAAGCLASYLYVFAYYSITPDQLYHSSVNYWRVNSPEFVTSTGQVYSGEEQVRIHGQAKSAWHITLVMSQVFHYWLCTTRRISIFEHGIYNKVAVVAVLIEIALLVFMIYTPGVQTWLDVAQPPASVWIFCLPVGVVLVVFNELRKWFIRNYPSSKIVKAFKW